MGGRFTRRAVLAAGASLLAAPALGAGAGPFRFGLTPVFLDNDAAVIEHLRAALAGGAERRIELVQRRTYQEVTGLLLEGGVDAAWLCGYPYLQHREALALIGVPVWRGRPLYQSYLIVGAEDGAERLEDLRGGAHAFSDPDSNSGWLVTVSDLARRGERAERFFSRSVVTWGHRNVVRAVASGLTRSGSVDGYVWEALAKVEPALTAGTRVIFRSEWLGFPPFVARADRIRAPAVAGFGEALLAMNETGAGRAALSLLQIDRVTEASPALFDGIAARMRDLASAG